MKKIKVALFAFVLGSLALTSCSSDSDSTPATIVGKWTQKETVNYINGTAVQTTPYAGNETGCEKDYIQFLGAETGGTFKDQYFYKVGTATTCTEASAISGDAGATFVKSSDNKTLTITGNDDYADSYTIDTFTSGDLIISTSEVVSGQTFKVSTHFTKL